MILLLTKVILCDTDFAADDMSHNYELMNIVQWHIGIWRAFSAIGIR